MTLTAAELRHAAVWQSFVPHATKAFARDPTLRSCLLSVAQYWADEADDAVHAHLTFSPRETPLWPHRCGDDESATAGRDFCSYCNYSRDDGELDGWLDWDDNGDAIPAFQAFCRDDGSQDTDPGENYLPYAVARRAVDGSVDVTIVGEVVRGYLDIPPPPENADVAAPSPMPRDPRVAELFAMVLASPDDERPRAVLGDLLEELGDPRAELIALQLRRSLVAADTDRVGALIARHGRAWLGRLAEIVPMSGVTFARGFAETLAVHIADEEQIARITCADEWATVARLRFLPGSLVYLGGEMRGLHGVGPINHAALRRLDRAGEEVPAEGVAVDVDSPDALLLLARFPRLTHLAVSGEHATVAGLTRVFAARPLASLEVRSLVPEVVSSWLAARPAFTGRIAFSAPGHARAASGFRLELDRDTPGRARLTCIGLDADVTLTDLGELLGQLPADITRIEMVNNRLFTPSEADLADLVQRARRTVVALG